MIIRVEHTEHFTIARNKTVRDCRLSFRATGLLVYLLSLSDDATVNAEGLGLVKREGEKAVRTALRELEAAGYLERTKHQNERGQWVSEATVRECPLAEKADRPPKTAGRKTARRKQADKVRSTKEGAALNASPAAPPEETCAICGMVTRYMREDGAWLCASHEESPILRVLDGA